jgi:hypothetical protein
VAPAHYPSYLGFRDQEDYSLIPAPDKMFLRSGIRKNPSQNKGLVEWLSSKEHLPSKHWALRSNPSAASSHPKKGKEFRQT